MKNIRNHKGNVLVTVLLIIAAFGLMIPAIVNYVKNEAKWSVKEKKQTEAFHLAEAAHDRGYWKLCESSNNWSTVTSGSSIAGYCNDVVYTDVSGGSYKISIYKISASSVGILATAKDSASKEFRAIRGIYSKSSVTAAIQAPSFGSSGNANIWWGPIYSMSNMDLASGASNKYHPRKMAKSSITGSGSLGDRCAVISNPNTDNREFWAFNSWPGGVPATPTVDIAYYKQQAITGGTYYTDANHTFGADVDAAPKYRYCESGANIKSNGTYMRGYLIVIGDLELSAKGSGSYATTPPTTAWKEYAKNVPTASTSSTVGDTAASNEYPGDNGYQNSSKSYTIGCGSYGGGNKDVAFRGFIYVTGSFSSGANTVIHGAIVVTTGGAFGGGGCELWYDDTLSIQTSNSVAGSRDSWKEEVATPF